MNLRLFLLLFLLAMPAHAGVEQLSEKEFQKLSEDLAPKVNLFQAAWDADPEAQFYGGTTRDYLYWIKGQFRGARTPAEAKKIADTLRARPAIDVREFIIGDSDVDLFSEKAVAIRPDHFGVKKIDVQKPEVLDPKSALGRNEVDQGFIPAEKIRLARNGLRVREDLGNGIHEIYSGKLTVHFAPPEVFARSQYAAEGINHPVLLAIRYLRLQGIDYFQTHGQGPADKTKLLAQLDPASAAAVHRVIDGALDGKELRAPLEKPQFEKWINAGIKKAFRSYTNPNATKLLMEEFRVTELPGVYPEKIEPVNQYVFAKHRDPRKVAAAVRQYTDDPARLFRTPATEFPDGFFYHGTRTEPAFRAILLQGVLESESGSGGRGLYGVRLPQKDYAEHWAGAPERLLRFPIQPSARIIDVTEGPGQKAWEKFKSLHGEDYEAFADEIGADIVRYPYGETRAYVVKNSEALGKAEGVYREVLPLPELLDRMKKVTTLDEFEHLLSVNALSKREGDLAAAATKIPMPQFEAAIARGEHLETILRYFLPRPPLADRLDLYREMLPKIPIPIEPLLKDLFAAEPWSHREDLFVELLVDPRRGGYAEVLGRPGVPYLPEALAAAKERYLERWPQILLPIYKNPAYAGDVKTLKQILAGREIRQSLKMAVDVVAMDHWSKHPELAKRIFALDLTNLGTMASYPLLTSPAWNRDQPQLLRTYLKKFLTNPSSQDFTLADHVLTAPHNPFTAETVKILLANGYRDADLIDEAGEEYLRPYRNLIVQHALKMETPDFARLGSLDAQGLLSQRQRKAVLAKLEDAITELEGSWLESIELAGQAPSLAKDSPKIQRALEAMTEEKILEGTLAPDLAVLKDYSNHSELAWTKSAFESLAQMQEGWLAKLKEPRYQELLKTLVRELPPDTFLPFVRAGITSRALPRAVKAEIVKLLVDAPTRLWRSGATGGEELFALYEIARAEASLAKNTQFLEGTRNMVYSRRNARDASFAFPALYLHEQGLLPADLEEPLWLQHEFLEEFGLHYPQPKSCAELYGKVGG